MGASGLGSQFGGAKETTYGTFATPTKFQEFDSETFGEDPNYLESGGLRAGRTFQSALRTKRTTHQAPGVVTLDFPTKGGGWMLDLLHGLVVAPVQQASTPAYLQDHPIGTSLVNKSATMQFNTPDSAGVDHPKAALGCMVTQWQFSLDTSGVLKLQLTCDARDIDDVTALATAAYPTGVDSFDFTDALVTTLAGASLATASSFTLTGSNPLKTNRWFLGSGALKSKPIANGFTTVEGTLDAEFESTAALAHFKSAAPVAIVIACEGDVISGAHKYMFKADMPACQVRGTRAAVGGPDVLDQRIPFKVLDNGVAVPLTLSYKTTDLTL